MLGRAGLVGKDHGHGGPRHLRWRELGLCLTNALLQQEAVGRHRLEARLRKLSQGQILLVVVERRRQGLRSWRHQMRNSFFVTCDDRVAGAPAASAPSSTVEEGTGRGVVRGWNAAY